MSVVREGVDAAAAPRLANVWHLRHVLGQWCEVGPQLERRLHLLVVRSVIAFILGQAPGQAKFMLEIVDDTERAIDAIALAGAAGVHVFQAFDIHVVVLIPAIQTRLGMASFGEFAGCRAIRIRHAAPREEHMILPRPLVVLAW